MPPKTRPQKVKARASKPTTAPTASADPAHFDPHQRAATELHDASANVLDKFDATLEEFLHKSLPYCLRLGVARFKEFEDNVRTAVEACNFQRRAYQGARKDAIRTGLVIGETEQWVGDEDGPLQLFCGRKPGGPVEVFKMPILAADRALQEAYSHFADLCSRITTAVREAAALYHDLVAPNSALARVCDNESRWKKDVPEWATKTLLQVPEEWDDEYAGCYKLESGDLAVRMYWSVLKPELIQLAAAIERREQRGAAARADDIESDLLELGRMQATARDAKEAGDDKPVLTIHVADLTATLRGKQCKFDQSPQWEALKRLARHPGSTVNMSAPQATRLRKILKPKLEAVAKEIYCEHRGRYAIRTSDLEVRVIEPPKKIEN